MLRGDIKMLIGFIIVIILLTLSLFIQLWMLDTIQVQIAKLHEHMEKNKNVQSWRH